MRFPLPAALGLECRCGHPREAHEHYRRGSDCAACAGACARFRVRLVRRSAGDGRTSGARSIGTVDETGDERADGLRPVA